jgi:Domain of unknown function (DUF1707)/PASTA domain
MSRGTKGFPREPSDAARSAAQDMLGDAVAAGLLTLDDFSERARTVWSAQHEDELRQVLSDVAESLIGDTPRTSRIVAVFSDHTEEGRPRVAQKVGGLAVAGDIKLDLRAAVWPQANVELRFWGLLGSIAIILPEGLTADLAGLNILSSRKLRPSDVQPLPASPNVRVRVHSLGSTVFIQSGESRDTPRQWSRRGRHSRHCIGAIVAVLAASLIVSMRDNKEPPSAQNLTRAAPAPSVPASDPAVPAPPTTTPTSSPTLSPTPPPPRESSVSVSTPSERITPNVVGARVTDAIIALHSAGIYNVNVIDGSAENRTVLNYRNWQVDAQSPSAGSVAAAGESITLTASKPTDSSPELVEDGTVPDVSCEDLADAQEILHRAGFTTIRLTDGSGENRTPLLPLNWVVVAQSVAAHKPVPSNQDVTLTVVKYGEDTGASGCRD